MSEEELRAIEYTKSILKFPKLYASTEIDGNFLRGIDKEKLDTLLNLIEKQQKELENIKKEVQEHIAFENRLKRDGTEPDLFNQGRFYVANNIKDILDGKEII